LQRRSNEAWPGPDENAVIDAMLDQHHPLYTHHWKKCNTFVTALVTKFIDSSLADKKEDIIQETMVSIVRSLPEFKRRCRLTYWITKIVHSRIADAGRDIQNRKKFIALPPTDPREDDPKEDYLSAFQLPRTVEDECIDREDLREAFTQFLNRYANHAHRERLLLIWTMHLAGYSQKEIAQELGSDTSRRV
jgi:RNA polymerase sigma factor (sigma-70 family)